MADKCARGFPHKWEKALRMGTSDVYFCWYCEGLRWVPNLAYASSPGSVERRPPSKDDIQDGEEEMPIPKGG